MKLLKTLGVIGTAITVVQGIIQAKKYLEKHPEVVKKMSDVAETATTKAKELKVKLSKTKLIPRADMHFDESTTGMPDKIEGKNG